MFLSLGLKELGKSARPLAHLNYHASNLFKEQSVQNLRSFALPNIMIMITFLCLPCDYQFSFRVTFSIFKDPVKLLKVVETTEITITLVEPWQNLTAADNNYY